MDEHLKYRTGNIKSQNHPSSCLFDRFYLCINFSPKERQNFVVVYDFLLDGLIVKFFALLHEEKTETHDESCSEIGGKRSWQN